MVLGKKHGTGYLPYTCVKSHLNDKPTCCLPLRPQSRHSNLWYFGAQLLSLQPCSLRLAHYIAVIHSRLASNAVVSSLFDRISTCRIARPLLDARSGTRYSHSTPFDIIWTFVHTLLTVPDPELHGAPLLPDPKQPPQTDDSNLSVCRVQNWQFSHFFL